MRNNRTNAKSQMNYYLSENARRRRETNSPAKSGTQSNAPKDSYKPTFDNSSYTSYTNNINGFNTIQKPMYKPEKFEELKKKNEQIFAPENNSYASTTNAPAKEAQTPYNPSYNTSKVQIPKVTYINPNKARGMATQEEYQNYLNFLENGGSDKAEYGRKLEKYLERPVSGQEINGYMRHSLNLPSLKKEYDIKEKPKRQQRVNTALHFSAPVRPQTNTVLHPPEFNVDEAYKNNTNGVKDAFNMWYKRIAVAPFKGKYWFEDMIEAQEDAEKWFEATYGKDAGKILYKQLHNKILNTSYDDHKKLDELFKDDAKDDLIPLTPEEFSKKHNIIKGTLALGKGPLKAEFDPLPDSSKEGHRLLDTLGWFPGGEVFDGLNALLYYNEGDKLNAVLSGVSLLGTVGDTVGKGAKGLKLIDDALDITGDISKTAGKAADTADIVLDLKKLPITEKGLADKMPPDLYKEARNLSLKNPDAPSLTLGKYTGDADSYIARAGNDSSYFDLGNMWDEIKRKYEFTNAEMFEYFNIPVIDDAIKKGKVIQFSHDPRNAKGFLKQEWNYIKKTLGKIDSDLIFKGGFWYVK